MVINEQSNIVHLQKQAANTGDDRVIRLLHPAANCGGPRRVAACWQTRFLSGRGGICLKLLHSAALCGGQQRTAAVCGI